MLLKDMVKERKMLMFMSSDMISEFPSKRLIHGTNEVLWWFLMASENSE